MTGLLRAIRGLVGLLIVLQPFGLVINLLWLLPNPGADHGYGITAFRIQRWRKGVGCCEHRHHTRDRGLSQLGDRADPWLDVWCPWPRAYRASSLED